jgi:hypothetical protein
VHTNYVGNSFYGSCYCESYANFQNISDQEGLFELVIMVAFSRKSATATLQCSSFKEVKVRGGKAPYAGNALKVMPIVPSPATFYDRERP